MDSNLWLQAIAVALAVLCVVLYKVSAKRFNGVNWHAKHVPFLGSTLDLQEKVLQKQSHTAAMYFAEEFYRNGYQPYGISLIGGKVVIVVVDPADIKAVLKDQFYHFEKPATVKEMFAHLMDKSIFLMDGPEWKEQRTITSHLFSRRQLRDRMSSVFGVHSQQMIGALQEQISESPTVDIQKVLLCVAFDSINSVAFNRQVNSLGGNPEDLRFQDAFDKNELGTCQRFMVPWWKVDRYFQSSVWERMVTETTKVTNAYVDRVVDEYVDANGRPKTEAVASDQTLTGLFMQHALREGTAFTRLYIRNMIFSFIVAGRDTTGSALTSCVDILSRPENTEWQERLHGVALECFGGKANVEEPLSFDDITGKAVVCEAVILESLRLQPPVPMNEKVCVKATTLPSGVHVPEGAFLSWCPVATNRVPDYWGEDALAFKPTRWIEDGRVSAKYDDYTYSTFNCGPRLCLGKNMALLEMQIVLLTLLARFKITPKEGFVPKPINSLTRTYGNGFMVNLEKRH
ncbi:Cytochrome P450 94A1 [Diplonema papillatum]|nr:Cytochrome P450 94A1 [Diplonema papillatum]